MAFDYWSFVVGLASGITIALTVCLSGPERTDNKGDQNAANN